MNKLQELEACGQAPWLDYLKRDLIEGGSLKKLIDEDGLKGVTSNPSIFQKAIGEDDTYAGAIKDFLKDGERSLTTIYEHLAIADIKAACDIMRTVYDKTGGRDGYVSLECSPYLANDTEGTVKEAEHLWQAVDRPNLMVKVPATPAGIPAIARLIGQGINVNVTLLFSVEAYETVAAAYLTGLETLQKSGGDLSKVASVASFFVSRIDTAVNKQLEDKGERGAALKNKVAIANAKVAYLRYKDLFSGDKWDALAKAGAQTQRLLWASTSVKDKALKDTLYVDALIGQDTVDTIPPATMDAFREHGEVKANAIEDGAQEARETLASLEAVGVKLDEITKALVVDGVQQFADAFDKLFDSIAKSRREVLGETTNPQTIEPGSDATKQAFVDEMERWRSEGLVRKLWAVDKTLWTSADEDKWGGWLDIVEEELKEADKLQAFGDKVKADGVTDIVLLGMGGSSLGPEVLSDTFGHIQGRPRFHMLDATDPAQVKAIEDAVAIKTTLFIVQSKSGSTLEPNIFTDYFFDAVSKAVGKDKAGRQFAVVTDPGSSMETRAKASGFAHIFYGKPSIGGRYSVLSKFGLVPAAAMGVDVKKLLTSTLAMVHDCAADTPPKDNPGVELGVALGVAAAKLKRDKITIIASPGIGDVGAWLEQLMAESTGKHGKGLIPLADEAIAAPDKYGSDRFFAYLELEGKADAAQKAAVDALAEAGHPVAYIQVKDVYDLGQEFFRWEIATAVAGAIIGINPFDQPDVEASKKKAKELTDAYEKTHTLAKQDPVFEEDGIALYADDRNASELGRHDTLDAYLKAHFGRLGEEGDYAAFLAYVERNEAHIDTIGELRTFVRDQTKAATCVGFGPRFQHSTGQAYKGGPNTGVFLQITCDDAHDLDVPGHGYTFGVVKAAQARGDLEVLNERGRRTLRVHLKDVDKGLPDLARAVQQALS